MGDCDHSALLWKGCDFSLSSWWRIRVTSSFPPKKSLEGLLFVQIFSVISLIPKEWDKFLTNLWKRSLHSLNIYACRHIWIIEIHEDIIECINYLSNGFEWIHIGNNKKIKTLIERIQDAEGFDTSSFYVIWQLLHKLGIPVTFPISPYLQTTHPESSRWGIKHPCELVSSSPPLPPCLSVKVQWWTPGTLWMLDCDDCERNIDMTR